MGIRDNKIKLYHYKPLNDLRHFTHLKNYINQKIWFTRLDKFNDPFEGKFYAKYANTCEIIKNHDMFLGSFEAAKISAPNITEDEFIAELRKPSACEIIGGIDKVNDDFASSHSAICLTPDYANIPMWSYYADSHQGYCVQFEIDLDIIINVMKKDGFNNRSDGEIANYIKKIFYPNENDTDQDILSFSPTDSLYHKYILSKVIYKEEKPMLEQTRLSEISNQYEKIRYIVMNSFGVKFKQWEHDDEYRFIINQCSQDKGGFEVNLLPDGFIKITGIIMGCKIGENIKSDALDKYEADNNYKFVGNNTGEKIKKFILDCAEQNKIEVYQTECSKEKYEIKCTKFDRNMIIEAV